MFRSKKLISVGLALALAIGTISTSIVQTNAAASKAGNRIGKPVIINHKPTKKVDPNSYLEIPNGEVVTLDCNLADDNVSMRVLGNVNECLTRQDYDSKGNSVNGPGAAERWEVSPDGCTWTFYLRKMYWTDGKLVTAKDFETSWLRLLDPKLASSYAYFINFVKGAEEYNKGKGKRANVGVRALSQSKFQVILKRPTPHFEKVLAFTILAPVRADIVAKLGDKYGTQSSYKKMVWCGPFTVDSWTRSQRLVMKKNAKYWDVKNVNLSKVTYHLTDYELATQIQMFKNNQLDRTGASGDYLVALKNDAKSGKYRFYTDVIMTSRYFTFNGLKNPIFKNVKVRKAFALAVDRDVFTRVVQKKDYPSYSLIPPTMMSGSTEFRKTSKDWMKDMKKQYPDAKKLLIEGLKELKMNPDPSKVDVQFLTYGAGSVQQKRVEFFQGQIKKNLGIDVKLQHVADWSQFCNERQNKNFQFTYEGWGADYNDPMTFLDMWTTGNAQNDCNYSNKAYDKLIADASKEQNMVKRNALLVKAEKLLVYDDCGLAPISIDDVQSFFQKYVVVQKDFKFGCEFDFKYAYTSGRKK